MGGDFGPEPIVKGTLEALKEKKFEPILVGKKDEILSLLPKGYKDKILIVEADDVIDMSDAATDALKRKESSIYKAIELVREGKADGVVSAGHSGATMSLATLRLGRLKHVLRPALVTLMPTKNGQRSVMLDVGANVDCKAEHLFQFGIMGYYYAQDMLGLAHPRVGLLANGEESSKGNEVTKETFGMLQNEKGFIGNVEGNNIFDGSCDVIVCDGFVGNVALKLSEGLGSALASMLKTELKKSIWSRLGTLIALPAFKRFAKKLDYAEYGGAPILGLNGIAIVCHGASNARAITTALQQAALFVQKKANDHLVQGLHANTELSLFSRTGQASALRQEASAL